MKNKSRYCKKCSKQFKSSMQKRICYDCWRAEKKTRREERAKKKLERKLNSKKWLNKEKRRVTGECDNLWKKAVIAYYGDKCVICGNVKINIHHIIGRRNKNVRWYIPNGCPLCAGDHTFLKDSAHQNPLKFRQKMIELRGEAWEKDLIEKGNQAWDKDIYKIKNYLLNGLK